MILLLTLEECSMMQRQIHTNCLENLMLCIFPGYKAIKSLYVELRNILIRYKVYNEQHPRAGLKIQHVIYEQLARAGRNT